MMSNEGHPWSSDRSLDAELVRSLVRSCAPEFADEQIHFLGEGWDNEVFSVGGRWAFRFPKREAVVETLERELATAPALAERLPVAIPKFEIFGRPGDLFPYPFVGYRLVPGAPLDTVELPYARRPALAADLAEVLDHFAAFSDDPACRNLPKELFDPESARREALDGLEALDGRVAPTIIERWRRYCVDAPVPSNWANDPVYIHNDLFGEHLLVDPHTFALTGIIDFADQMLGDPVFDLVGLATTFDLDFAFDVAHRVTAWNLAEADADRLVYLTRVMPMRWAIHAAMREEPAGVERHVETVERGLDYER